MTNDKHYRAIGYRFVSRLLGGLLIFAALSKILGGSTQMSGPSAFLFSPMMRVLTIEVELLLGLFLISQWRPNLARVVTIFFFSFLNLISFRLILEGQSSCGCFGRIVIDPWVTLIIDSLAVIALVVCRPRPDVQQSGNKNVIFTGASWIVGAASILLIASTIFMLTHNVGPDALVARLRGEDVSLYPSQVDIGRGRQEELHEFNITLANHSDRDIEVTGSSASCSCNLGQSTPFVIKANSSTKVPVSTKFRGSPGRFLHQFWFYTNNPKQTAVVAKISGTVAAPD